MPIVPGNTPPVSHIFKLYIILNKRIDACISTHFNTKSSMSVSPLDIGDKVQKSLYSIPKEPPRVSEQSSKWGR